MQAIPYSQNLLTHAFQPLAALWRVGPLRPVLSPNEVHVWKVDLAASWSNICDEVLSPDERNRAARFRFAVDRQRFSVSRASLRIILGRYLIAEASALRFDLGEYGKPRLAGAHAEQGIRFNVSHSNQLALIAIARDREVGVDIEFKRVDFATDEIAEHFFSISEQKQFAATEPDQRTDVFFNCWTRKEAYVKARGEGLSFPLDQFDVSLIPGATPRLLDNRIDPEEMSRWSFQELSPAPGFAAALAVEGAFSRLELWELDSD